MCHAAHLVCLSRRAATDALCACTGTGGSVTNTGSNPWWEQGGKGSSTPAPTPQKGGGGGGGGGGGFGGPSGGDKDDGKLQACYYVTLCRVAIRLVRSVYKASIANAHSPMTPLYHSA